jgi:hypothetical protein
MDLRIGAVEPTDTPGEVLAEPVEGSLAEKGAFLFFVRLVRVRALAAARRRGRAGGMLADGGQYVFGQRGLRGEGI